MIRGIMLLAKDVKIGKELKPVSKKSYQRALDEREFDDNSIHNDDYTKGQGYSGALTSSYVLCGYMSELMVNNFGDGFIEGGEISLKYINGGVQQGDPIECKGRVSDISIQGEQLRVSCEIWMEKFGSKKVVVGTAAASVNE